ncbi:hypothetical protein ACE01N_20165 [Saccharicrinis sp. FJH2]|uniref:hypothetical protein n=1 Tax=Saccharicrinis sp. FJH65 TaxID=3344659 RepID=UPI0035F44C37
MKHNRRIVLIIICVVCLTVNYGCKIQSICDMFLPRHEITFENDSVFKYTKWIFDTDTNSFGYYSEGRYLKIDKNTYILNSYDFNPDSIRTDWKFNVDSSITNYRIRITTELEDEDFKFNHDKIVLKIDSDCYEFKEAIIDTFFSKKPEIIRLKLLTQPDSVIPKGLYRCFTSIPIENIPESSNYINIEFPVSWKYYNWHPLVNKILYKRGKGKKSSYYLWGDKWKIKLKKK